MPVKSLVDKVCETVKKMEDGIDDDDTRRQYLYRLIQRYRTIKDKDHNVTTGTLSFRETWLFDNILDIFKVSKY